MKSTAASMFESWPVLLAGIMATLVGIGLARFAYTPLIPVLIEAQWFSASSAVYLGAANLLGYLVGALSAHRLTERFASRWVVALSLATIVLSFWFCAFPGGFYWFFVWRVLSGVSGAILLVVVPSLALSCTPIDRRAMVGTLVFSGVGLGAVLSAVVIPLLLAVSLSVTWLVLGAIGVLAALLCDQGMKRLPAQSIRAHPQVVGKPAIPIMTLIVMLVMAAYALDAVGFVPHTVFWVDYLAREQGFGQAPASFQWALFGLGAACGPLLVGLIVRRIGWHRTLLLVFSAKSLAVLLPVLSLSLLSQSVSSLVVGALSPGIVAVISGRIAELVGPSAHKLVWGRTTAVFAAAQAFAGYAMSAFYEQGQTYTPLFVMSSTALALGLVLIVVSRRAEQRGHSSPTSSGS